MIRKFQNGQVISIEELYEEDVPIEESPMIEIKGPGIWKGVTKSKPDSMWRDYYDINVRYYQPEKDSEIANKTKDVETKSKEFYKKWYSSPLRKAVYKLNLKDSHQVDDSLENQFKRLDDIQLRFAEVDTPMDGGMNHRDKIAFISEFKYDDPYSTAVHELSHGARAEAQQEKVKEILNKRGYNDKYWDNPSEAFSRLMEIRYNFNVDPNKEVTLDDINKFKEMIKSGEKKDYQFLNRYDDNTLRLLMNLVAHNNNNYFDDSNYYG